MQPKVSILIPSYNCAETLPLALSSVLMQTYENYECIIVNDGSTDATKEVLGYYQYEPFRVVHLEKNYGRGYARNVALECARGDLVAWLDADDFFYPDKIKKQVTFLQNHDDIACVSTRCVVFDDSFQVLGISRTASPYETYGSLKIHRVHFPTIMIYSEIAKKFMFDERFYRAEDYDFLLRIVNIHKIDALPDILYAYRGVYKESVSRYVESKKFVLQSLIKYGMSSKCSMRDVAFLCAKEVAKVIYYVISSVYRDPRERVQSRYCDASDEEIRVFEKYYLSIKSNCK